MRLPGIAPEAVGDWLVEHVPELRPPLEFGLITGGRSNLTYQVVDADGRMLVLRRPPVGGVLSTAHDMHREWRFLTACAAPRCRSQNRSPTARLRGVRGRVLRDGARPHGVGRCRRGRGDVAAAAVPAGMATAECLAALHSIDPDEVGVATAGRRWLPAAAAGSLAAPGAPVRGGEPRPAGQGPRRR